MSAQKNGPDDNTADQSQIFLAIDLPENLARAFAGTRQIRTMSVEDITAASLAAYPTAVLACPLLGPPADAISVIQALGAAGFAGQLTVISPRLPNPAMVERELRVAARGFRVNLVPL